MRHRASGKMRRMRVPHSGQGLEGVEMVQTRRVARHDTKKITHTPQSVQMELFVLSPSFLNQSLTG
jgi:phenylalanyl-tRNA synthetase alpha subunit